MVLAEGEVRLSVEYQRRGETIAEGGEREILDLFLDIILGEQGVHWEPKKGVVLWVRLSVVTYLFREGGKV